MIGMMISVGAGGALGAMLRFWVGMIVIGRFDGPAWIATLAVNIFGCFLMGLVAAYISVSGDIPEIVKGFLIVGFLGALTTFSSFALDGYGFLMRDAIFGGLAYTALSIALSLGAFGLGFGLLRTMLGQG